MRLTLVLLASVTLASCAASAALRRGEAAERVGEYDRAVVEYTSAVRAKPDSTDARVALHRARVRAADQHFQRGRRLLGTGRIEDALIELEIAADLNPGAGDIEKALRDARTKLKARLAVRDDGKTALESLVERARARPVTSAGLPAEVTLPDSLVFRDAGSRDIYAALAHFAGINIVFDPAFRSAPLSIDLRQTTLEDALDALSTSTGNFYHVTAPKTITVAPDTPAKRGEYQQNVVRTFYLSNADLKETVDLLRVVIDSRRISAVSAMNAITINDSPERIEAAGRIIEAIDKARAEVVIDVELLEVDRRRFKEYGLQIASPGSAGPDGSVGVGAGDEAISLQSLRVLGAGDVIFTNLPRLFYRLLRDDSYTRVLANPQLRASDGIEASAVFGEQVPIPNVNFAPIAAGGVAQQEITSFTFEQVGVQIGITPRTHHNDDVSLALEVNVSSLAGTGIADIPIIGNRTIDTTIRLRDGETNMLAGLIRDEERTVLSGVLGLSNLPVVGRLFAANQKEALETDIVLMITPRIVRVLDLAAQDLEPFRLRDTRGRRGAMEAEPADLDEPPPDPQALPPEDPEPRPEDADPDQPVILSPLPGPMPADPTASPDAPRPRKPPPKPDNERR